MYPDLVNTTIFSQAGVAMCQYGIVDPATGLPAGPTGAIAKGSSRGLGRYIAIKSAAAPNPDPRVTNVTGDNGRFLHAYTFNPAELGRIDAAFGAMNMNAIAAFSNTNIDTVADSAAVGIGTNAPANARQVCLLITTDAQDADVTNFGQARYANYFYPLVNMYFVGPSITEVQGADFAFRGIPTQSGRYPWGVPFTQATNKFTRAKSVLLTSHQPLTMATAYVNGVQSSVTVNLGASPTTDETGTAIKAWRYVPTTGASEALTITDVDIAAQTATVQRATGSFADNDVITVLFESFDIQSN